MNLYNRRALRQRASQALAAAPGDPKKIVLFYTVITSVMALIMTVLTGFLTDRIDNTGGLGNMGLRSILSTGQTVLPLVQLFVTLCLNLGYHRAVLSFARQQEAGPRTLMEGFRYFLPVLIVSLYQVVLYLSFGILTLYASSFLFMMTPFAEPFYALMEPYLNAASALNGQLVLDDATLFAAMDTLTPMLWIWAGLFLLLFIPTYYGFRMTTFCIADNPRAGAFAAIRGSKFMLRGKRFSLFLLDVSMWWFYALQILVSLICYGDVILPLMGINLPWSSSFSYYFFFVLSLVVQIVSYYFLMNRVNVTYAMAYETLLQKPEPRDKSQDKPQPEPQFPFPREY